MKKLVTFWLAVGIGVVLTWLLLKSIDFFFTNGDGLLAGININVLYQYSSIFLFLVALCTMGFKSRFNSISNTSVSLLSLILFWLLGETCCFFLIRYQVVNAPRPLHSRIQLSDEWVSHQQPFWGDYNQSFGRWRRPSDSLIMTPVHGTPVQIRSNTFGMRDRERSLINTTDRKRVVLLGDSFVEGYIVQESQRYSNLLEEKTGIEHLNFGINGTSVINYYLTYKNLASKFDHDVVLVSILPANDFEDYEASQKRNLMRYPVYRPYWQGDFPHVKLDYSLADISQSLSTVANYNKPIQTQQVVDSVYHTLPLKDKIVAELSLNSYLMSCTFHWAGQVAKLKQSETNSFSKDFFEDRWLAFAYSLEQLARESVGKQVIFFTVPILNDLKAYHRDRTDDLSPRLEKLCRQYNITYINLLPYFYAQGEENWEKFYQEGDGHWNPRGERLVSEILLNHPDYLRIIEGEGSSQDIQEKQPVLFSNLH
jgi:lysophospholipase L1-like esterase